MQRKPRQKSAQAPRPAPDPALHDGNLINLDENGNGINVNKARL